MTEDRGTILIVEDDQEMRELVRDVLQEHGHRVTVTANGHEARDDTRRANR